MPTSETFSINSFEILPIMFQCLSFYSEANGIHAAHVASAELMNNINHNNSVNIYILYTHTYIYIYMTVHA